MCVCVCVCVEYNSQNKHKITALNINEANFIQLSSILMMMVVIAASEILATAGTETNSDCPIRVDAWLSAVHLKMEEDPDPETLWIF